MDYINPISVYANAPTVKKASSEALKAAYWELSKKMDESRFFQAKKQFADMKCGILTELFSRMPDPRKFLDS